MIEAVSRRIASDAAARRAEPDAMTPATDYAALFSAERSFLWGLCYRMTGVAADADDLVQETFARALAQPPPRTDAPWRPWLLRVAMNLARDQLRRRRRTPYRGSWLPSPVDVDEALPAYEIPPERGNPTEGHYELMESVSYAFLLALEALTPAQRAVLLLRDVFDYSVRETATALGLSEPNVKTTHHRARRAMAAYDRARCRPDAARTARTQEALARLMSALVSDDVPALEALLTADVHTLTDGGEFPAAHRPMLGRTRVIKLLRGLMRKGGAHAIPAPVRVNGLPALLFTYDLPPRFAPRGIMRCEVDAEGHITALHGVYASRKLTAVR
ncbi:MAG TPA: sigma-70 family RNA polymerase sigma factor [Rhizomicrobium sp.]